METIECNKYHDGSMESEFMMFKTMSIILGVLVYSPNLLKLELIEELNLP